MMQTRREKFPVTRFRDRFATDMAAEELSLPELCHRVMTTAASAKEKLPLLKLAAFGDQRSTNNSLRHNANVKTISGVELDYDAEAVAFEAAVTAVTQARILALIYTSPSHTAAAPRWRILAPTSTDLLPAARAVMAARINGVFGGILAPESFTLSQAYYYGKVGSNPDHRAVVITGDFIDERDELDADARGRGGDDARDGAEHVAGEGLKGPVAEVLTAFAVISNDDLEWEEWNRRAMAIYAATDGSDDGLAIFTAWSQKSPKHNAANTTAKWQSLRASPPSEIGIGSIRHWAHEVCPGWKALVRPRDANATIAGQMAEVAKLAQLATLPDILYERLRKETANELGIRVSALDEIIQKLRPASADVSQGSQITFDPLEPWLDAVDGATLIADMVAAIRAHVILSENQALAVTLWVLHAHALEAAEHTPRLQFKSPTVRCGKSTTMRTIKPMLPKPLSTENITTAALFRVIDLCQPTLMIDEADSFLKREDGRDNEELRGIMNAGHARGGEVIRTVGDNHEPKGFAVFAPVAFAWLVRNGRHVSETLADRSITIELRRRKRDEKITRLRSNRSTRLQVLGRKAARWVADHMTELKNADPTLPEELGDRAQDNWRLLVAIADAISADLGQKARQAAINIEKERIETDDDASITALADVAAIFVLKNQPDALKSQEIVDAMKVMEDRPWPEWKRGKPLTQASLARLLKPFSLRPKKIRIGATTAQGYQAVPVKEAADRYVEKEVRLEEGDLEAEM